jgi:hypothetical protein
MKKIIRKYWGIALVLVLLSTLFIAAAPTSAADPLMWNMDVTYPMNIPGLIWTQYPGTDIVDFAVSADGMTFYAALQMTNTSDNTILMKGIMGGVAWTDLTSATNNRVPVTLDSIDFVAISPDNPDIVCVVDAGGNDATIAAAVSDDGGLNFYDMGTIQGVNAGAIAEVFDLDVSPVSANNIYYIAIAGTDTAGLNNDPAIYYYNFGAAVGAWRDAVADFGTAAVTPAGQVPSWLGNVDAFKAVKFSKQFGSDFTLMAASENNTSLQLHILSMASHQWDDHLNVGVYPVAIEAYTAAGASDVEAAAITMGPDFMGLEEETIVSFLGASVLNNAGDQIGGIYRVDETQTVTQIRVTPINSITFDGTTLVSGSYDDNNVWRTLDVTVNQPTAASARSLKRIGVDDAGNDMVIVHYAGDTVYGSKRGAASALSRSTDYGNTWNDFYLIDSMNLVISDIMFSPDGSTWYMAADDGGEASVYRISATGTARVLCIAQTANVPRFMLRGIPDDADVVYAADKTAVGGTADIYVTADGGLTRWSRKTTYPGAAIADLCVESATVVYGATGVLVYKSTNSGSLWSAGVDTGVSGGVFNMISLGDGNLVVGGGSVVFSTDGGATWTPTLFTAEFFVNLYVAATGLGPTDYIYAASTGSNQVYRAPAAFFGEFKSMNIGAAATGEVNTGIALSDGILYVMQTDAGTPITYLLHSMAPTIPVHTGALWGTVYGSAANSPYTMNTVPGSALKVVSTATSKKLYGIDTAGAFGPGIYYFEDIVSLPSAAPVLIGPDNGATFDIVSEMLADAEQVVFSWTRAHPMITQYTLWIALDENFVQALAPLAIASVGPGDTVTSVQPRATFNPGVTYYWRVTVALPFNGVFSETRSFTVAPTASIVPDIGSPAAGATDVSENPAFSWTPVSGCTMYEVQISEYTGFAVPMVSEQVATTAYVPTDVTFEPGKTYFWRVRALEPVEGDWSAIAAFTIAVPAEPAPPPITVTTTPPPQITVTTPAPPPALTFTPPAEEEIAPAYIWAIIIIGAVLVIAVIVLIVRTRRSV